MRQGRLSSQSSQAGASLHHLALACRCFLTICLACSRLTILWGVPSSCPSFAGDADKLSRQEFAAMSWIKAAAVLHVLERGLVVMLAGECLAWGARRVGRQAGVSRVRGCWPFEAVSSCWGCLEVLRNPSACACARMFCRY